MNQLKEMIWLEQMYNIIFVGPPGVGKTHLAVGLGLEALYQGYKVMYITMGELIQILKTEEISRKSQTTLQSIRKAYVVIFHDLMFMAFNQNEANLFFQLINDLYNNASII